MAAIAAARKGRRVLLCEQRERPGIKLAATGGGHCNLTNTAPAAELMLRFGREGRFMEPALTRMDASGLRAFLAELGVATHAPDGFHVFPVTHRATTVRDALVREAERLHVDLRLGCRASALWRENHALRGICSTQGRLRAPRIIIATGGMGYQNLGATGDGYRLAGEAGHRVVAPLPAMVPLITRETWPARCTADTIGNARLRVNLPRKPGFRRAGDLIFTRTGITGPAVWDLSREIALLLTHYATVPLILNLTGGRTEEDWQQCFQTWRRRGSEETVAHLLAEELPSSLAEVFAGMLGEAGAGSFRRLPGERRSHLARLLARTPLEVTATAGFDQAMITRGGVALREVDPRTLQSRRVPNLRFCGELLDLDGPCGGYNLQWAFSSGYLAGASAAESR
jgi:predicted Rossmann fold flavoprotein